MALKLLLHQEAYPPFCRKRHLYDLTENLPIVIFLSNRGVDGLQNGQFFVVEGMQARPNPTKVMEGLGASIILGAHSYLSREIFCQ